MFRLNGFVSCLGAGASKVWLSSASSLLLGMSLFVASAPVSAASVEIADSPMASSTSSEIKPNVMFVLDDSGSMGWTHLPDHVKEFAASEAEYRRVGYVSSHCNGAYYDPSVTYLPPVNADGTSFPPADFNAALKDGYASSSGVVNLAEAFQAYDDTTSDGAGVDDTQPAYYYKYVGSKNPIPLSYVYTTTGNLDKALGRTKSPTFYAECAGKLSSTSAFEKVALTADHPEAQNFANWYSYYRIRLHAMKAAAGFAFKGLPNPDNFRIGYSTHSYDGAVEDASEFLKIGDYCSAESDLAVCEQRTSFYERLYSATPGGNTPLRRAMSRVGRLYAGKILTGVDDPIQYSCQQNFLILSTDGYWNGDGPLDLAGSSGVGDVDGDQRTPFKDALETPDTLADTALYYYDTDLRSDLLSNCTGALGFDVCKDDVAGSGIDNNNRQHMTTFTLGLGVNGSLKYSEDYLEGGSVDFNKILDESAVWPDPTDNFDLHRIDDLWHAAVNGRGRYYSAKTPDSLAKGISSALSGVSAMSGSGAASATSNLEPVAGDNFAYVASYRTVKWDGDLQAREIDLTDGGLSSEDERIWSAKERLSTVSASARTIYFNDGGALSEFVPANLSAEMAALFEPCGAAGLTQCANEGFAADVGSAQIVEFIRGEDTLEDQTDNAIRVLRNRESKLGDIVNSQPVYVKKSPFSYTDTGYAKFAEGNEDRQGVVIVGANDGMLHAFNADTGDELWAFVPTPVMGNLYKLADSAYADNHQYYVDGPIAVADICADQPCRDNGNGWKTILVAGLGKGGKGYFALDITDTTAPALLWEFTAEDDSNLGYTFGNPIITKVEGKWVVVFASGYNNTEGDGRGRVFMLDAVTGAKLVGGEIVTNDSTDPNLSGVARLSNWVDNGTYDNSTQFVYGGDLSGNLWRVDLVAKNASRLAQLSGPDGSMQSITTKPELALVKVGASTHRVVFVGTGRYLGLSDLSDATVQSLYAVKDDLTTDWGVFRSQAAVVEQEISAEGIKRFVTSKAMSWADSPGWFVDFDIVGGERITTDIVLDRGVLVVVTNVPETDACNVGGYSYIYFFDYRTGSYVTTVADMSVGHRLANAIGVGMSVIRVDGKSVAIVTTSDNRHVNEAVPEYSSSGTVKRMLWREIFAD